MFLHFIYLLFHILIQNNYISGNYGSHLIEILVAHSTRSREFVTLIPSYMLMSVTESKQEINKKKVKMFRKGMLVSLSHYMPLFSFYTSWKHQKTRGFLMFSGGIEREQWHEMA